jgi:thymidylate synthase ThyX
MAYSSDEKKLLSQYFTSTEDSIFALVNLPEVIKGSLFSRYSRTAKDLRRLFLDEFIKADELKGVFDAKSKAVNPALDVERADDFYERILVGYGDDSVAELGGVHVAIEQVSMLATKSIEEHRLGLSPLEKSTRYVYFDKKINDEYGYYKDPKIMASKYRDLYIEVNNTLFDTYSHIVREIQPILKKIYPGDESDTAYKFSIRAKACDIARGLLPLSATTNMGVFGNGRSFEYLLITLLNDPLHEVKDIGKRLNENLTPVVGAFVKRATNERGNKYRDYLNKIEEALAYSSKYTKKIKPRTYKTAEVKLVDYDKDAIDMTVAAVLYPRSNATYKEVRAVVKTMTDKEKEKILKVSTMFRENRHHKVSRAFEEPYFSFDVIADWGVYKDLMRHRVLTRHKQLFTNELGYITPHEIVMTGFEKPYREAMNKAVDAYKKIKKDFPHEAQYLVTHGAYNRFYMRMNLREVIHMTELRSSPQGHPTYRQVAQMMAKVVSEKFPLFGKYMFPFVDYKNYELERLSAFKKIAAKAAKLGAKGFED